MADQQAAAFQQYLANSGFDANASTAQAQLFIQACRQLLLLLPESGSQQAASMKMNTALIAQEMNDAKQWLASNPDQSVAPGGVGYFSFNNFR
jgi:hypothetical protein